MESHHRSQRHYQFFKVVLPSTVKDKKLRIPPKFVRIFRDELGCVATLTTPAGRVWKVGLEMDSGKNAWFCDGWEEFADHNYIIPGYFLVFGYEGNSKFRVCVFDLSGCEVSYPDESLNGSPKQNHGKKFSVHPEEEEEEEEDDDDDELQDDAHAEVYGSSPPWRTPASLKQRQKQGTFRNPSKPQKRGEGSPRSGLGVENHGRDVDPLQFTKSKRACCARGGTICSTENSVKRNARTERAHDGRRPDPTNPSFKVTIKPYNIASSFLNVPWAFSSENLRSTERVKLRDGDGKLWPVKCCFPIQWKAVKLTKGWADFVVQKNLKAGDVLLFELAESKVVPVLNVYFMPPSTLNPPPILL